MASLYKSSFIAMTNLSSCSWIVLCYAILTQGCAISSNPSPEELALLDNPPEKVRQKQEMLTPLTLEWFAQIEKKYLAKGRQLTTEELSIAKVAGITHPDRVRVVVLKNFPFPKNKTLLMETREYGLGSSAEGGRSVGYVVMLKAQHKDERWILARELTHVAQQERMGRTAYVRRFIVEHELMGRNRAPLVLDANKVALEFQ
jgi:hypothetical protein